MLSCEYFQREEEIKEELEVIDVRLLKYRPLLIRTINRENKNTRDL